MQPGSAGMVVGPCTNLGPQPEAGTELRDDPEVSKDSVPGGEGSPDWITMMGLMVGRSSSVQKKLSGGKVKSHLDMDNRPTSKCPSGALCSGGGGGVGGGTSGGEPSRGEVLPTS